MLERDALTIAYTHLSQDLTQSLLCADPLDQVRHLGGQKTFEFIRFQRWTFVSRSRVELADQCVDGLLQV